MTQTKLEVEQRGTKHNITDRVLNTAGLLIRYTHTKINLPTNQRGYDTFETTVGKLSARRIQI